MSKSEYTDEAYIFELKDMWKASARHRRAALAAGRTVEANQHEDDMTSIAKTLKELGVKKI